MKTLRKNSKNESANGVSATDVTPTDSEGSAAAERPSSSKKSAKRTKASSPAPASKKKSAKVVARKSPAAKRSRAKAPNGPSDADIRLRAYFIAERRVQLALQGDPANDWLEAKRQLVEETRQAGS